MVSTNTLISSFAAIVILFTDCTTAGALPPATTSSNTISSSAPSPTDSPKFIFTQTDDAGRADGCTATSLQIYLNPYNRQQTTDTWCSGEMFPLSTNAALASEAAARASAFASVNAPDSGCAIVTFNPGGNNDPYCTCAGTGTAPASSVSTMLGYSRRATTTACNTGKGSLPTDWVEVPEIAQENFNTWGIWATPPSFAVAGNCTTAEKLDSRCWEALDMDEYVKWWWGAFNGTCEGSAFAECFYIAMTPYAPSDCSIFGEDPACTKPNWSDFNGTWNDVRNTYVAWNLYNINAFISDYWHAVGNAGGLVEGNIGEIVNYLRPVKKTNVLLDSLMQALTSGLAFVPGPDKLIMKSMLAAAAQSGFVTKLVLPISNTLSDQLVEIEDLQSNASILISTMQTHIAQTLPYMVNDVNTFAAATAEGAYSQFLPSLDDFAQNALKGLNAYIISQVYQVNGVFITRQLNTSVRALMTNGTNVSYPLDCTSDYDSNGVCGTFWYDSIDDTTYSLMSPSSNDRWNTYNADMSKFFPAYTDGETLFRGAANCAAQAGANQGQATPATVSQTTGTYMGSDCLSNMKVCTWNLNPGATWGAGLSWDPLFTDCTDLEVFDDMQPPVGPRVTKPANADSNDPSGCKGVGDSDDIKLRNPWLITWRQYLGWGVHADRAAAANTPFCAGNHQE